MKLELLKLKVATAAIAVILFAANIQITNAHQQHQQDQQQQGGLFRLFLQQLLTSEPATVENGTSTTTFQSTNDSFRVQVPQDWIIQDRNNADFSLAAEVLRGYGLLAQFCPAEQQQGALLVDAGGNTSTVSNSTSDNSNSCQRAQEVIHVLRYPNLGARLELDSDNNVTATNGSNISPDTILAFQMLKLQEVGYSDIRIVDSKDTTIDVTSSLLNNRAIRTIPAKLVEMTYSTNLDPNETRTGYFLSTATDLTPRNLGMTTGYGIFYERNSPIAAETMTASSITTLPTPVPVAQVFDSFELMAGAEVELAILASLNALLVQAASEEEKAAADVLKVEIDSSDTEGIAPATFEFEADITGGTKPYTVGWDIDDDEITESDEQTLVATFNEAGTYKIVLTVADIEGQIASDTLKIKIEEEELSPVDEKDDKKESQIEGTTQEQNQCNSLYPIACIDNLLNLYGLGSP